MVPASGPQQQVTQDTAVVLLERNQQLQELQGLAHQWCGVVCCGVVWCGVVWCGVVWCAVLCCGVLCCGVVWCGGALCVCCLYCVLNVAILFRNIEDLHDINKNIAMAVVEQGEILDNVEANVHSAGDRVAAGTEDLQKVGVYPASPSLLH